MVPVLILSVIAIVYGAAMSLVQPDMKRLVAYSSVSHMGFVTAGLFTFNLQGIEGSILQMVNHGILTGALFMMVGFFYDRTHTRLIKDYGGMAKPMPVAAAFFSLFVLGSLGLPGLNGFVGEFLILVGVVPVREGVRRDRLHRDHPGGRLPAVDVPADHVPAGQREVALAQGPERPGDHHPGAAGGHGRLDRHLPAHLPQPARTPRPRTSCPRCSRTWPSTAAACSSWSRPFFGGN